MNTGQPMYEWSDIPWHKIERNIYKLQKRIYKASNRGDVKLVRRLQKLLIKSWSAKCLSVRRVTQDNQGRKTAGVDGIKNLSPEQRLTMINKLTLGSKVSPTRRVWIPKPGKDEKRPLGIPTMYDRALQGLVKLGLEPEWEARFEPNSYGFRPGRSCHDAIGAIFNSIKHKPKYVLDADISQCFDRINQEKLLEKLNTFPSLRRQIRAWLKAGVFDGTELKPTSHGTPQGGVISPLLANIALHGMENTIKELVETFDIKSPGGHYLSKKHKKMAVSLIRYADDFVILHEDISCLNRCIKVITQWLNGIGLELKPSKTRLAHTLLQYEKEKPGFDFLGFNVRQYKTGKYTSGKGTRKQILGFKTLIKPSRESQMKHYKKLVEVINKHDGQSQISLICNLNPIIKGWTNYFSKVVSHKVFHKLNSILFWKLFRWGIKRHQIKGKKWIKNNYFLKIGERNWAFAKKISDDSFVRLHLHTDTKISRHVKVRGSSSPYDGNLIYWSSRLGKHPEMPTRIANLLKKQKGKCNICELIFRENDVIETDHIIPTASGGKDEYKNLQLLHRHCHDKKTKSDLEVIDNYQRTKRIDEFYKWFNKLNWVWNEDIPTMI